ncbi:MAG: hypothetical protein IJJ99_09995 [Oscillospiraceae bacterium]|nr:hypothetical protein [Oscillospiraceae bacterium]
MIKDVALRSVRCENGEDAALLYRLIAEEADGAVRYGAEIVMRRAGRTERATVRDVTASYGGIRALLALLSEHTVTPCTLRDVVEDTLNKI